MSYQNDFFVYAQFYQDVSGRYRNQESIEFWFQFSHGQFFGSNIPQLFVCCLNIL